MEKQTKTDLLAKLALLVVAILWGTSLTIVKQASSTFNPNFILAIRFSLACLVLAIIFFKKIKATRRSDLKSGLIIGICLFLAYSSQTLGVTFTTPGRSGFLSASYCVIVPFLAWGISKTKPDRYNVMAAFFCIAGIFFIAMTGENSSIFSSNINAIYGDGLALLSGFLFASHIVAVGKLGRGKDPILITILQFGVAAILAWLTTGLFEDNSTIVWSSQPIFEILYLALMCTAVALLLQNIGQKYTNPSSAAIILGFESVFGVAFPVLLGIESLTINSVIGFILIFIAIIISETKLRFLTSVKKDRPAD